MITHVVLFRLKDRSRKSIETARDMLLALRETVPVVRELEAGIDCLRLERSYDIALTVRFDSMADLDVYQKHPEHEKVAVYFRQAGDAVVSVDYES